MMPRSTIALLSFLLLAIEAAADETRTVVDADGNQWNEVHRTISHPQTQTHCVEQQQTVYQQQCNVQTYDSYRTYQVPVTEYHLESYWVGRFNPFVQPYLAQRYVPHTRWETRTEVVKVPVVQHNLVPVTRTVRVPVTTERVVNQDIVIHRQLVSKPTPAAGALASTPAADNSTVAVGGVKNMNPRPTSNTAPAAGSTFARQPANPARIASKPE